MSESSDTTHEAILHNVVAHQLVLRRQISEIQTELQVLLGTSRHGDVDNAEAEGGQSEDRCER